SRRNTCASASSSPEIAGGLSCVPSATELADWSRSCARRWARTVGHQEARVLLAIDTSTRVASVALYDGRVLVETTWHAGRDHWRQLLQKIDEALRTLGRSVADLTAIGVAIGPGSFNGLRVGVSTAKSIALAKEIPIVGVETLRTTAYAFRLTRRPIRPL